jgi:hypothetical protein
MPADKRRSFVSYGEAAQGRRSRTKTSIPGAETSALIIQRQLVNRIAPRCHRDQQLGAQRVVDAGDPARAQSEHGTAQLPQAVTDGPGDALPVLVQTAPRRALVPRIRTRSSRASTSGRRHRAVDRACGYRASRRSACACTVLYPAVFYRRHGFSRFRRAR